MDPVIKHAYRLPRRQEKTTYTRSGAHSCQIHEIFSLIIFSNITSSLWFRESILEFKLQGQLILDKSAQFQSIS